MKSREQQKTSYNLMKFTTSLMANFLKFKNEKIIVLNVFVFKDTFIVRVFSKIKHRSKKGLIIKVLAFCDGSYFFEARMLQNICSLGKFPLSQGKSRLVRRLILSTFTPTEGISASQSLSFWLYDFLELICLSISSF